jgi:toxin ParE1/3/4
VTVDVRPAAAADIRAACDYYRQARSGLDDELIEALDRLFARLDAFPRSAPIVAGYEDIRRAPIRKFPFAVFYRLAETEQIDVLRVLPNARSPAARPT